MSDELKRKAQEKLAQAQRLLDEAGELAEQGGFTLRFHHGGDYVPKSACDRETYRQAATEMAMKDGRYDGYSAGQARYTPWDKLDEDERSCLVDDTISDMMSEELPYQFREAGYEEGGFWWQPSNC